MLIACMIGKMIATVSGIESATTAPGRKPGADDAAGHDDGDRLPQRCHEFADRVIDDIRAGSETRTASMPQAAGQPCRSQIDLRTFLPRERMSPPSRMRDPQGRWPACR